MSDTEMEVTAAAPPKSDRELHLCIEWRVHTQIPIKKIEEYLNIDWNKVVSYHIKWDTLVINLGDDRWVEYPITEESHTDWSVPASVEVY